VRARDCFDENAAFGPKRVDSGLAAVLGFLPAEGFAAGRSSVGLGMQPIGTMRVDRIEHGARGSYQAIDFLEKVILGV
jgi:hypothetical protein